MGNGSKNTQCSVMGFQLCTMSLCKKSKVALSNKCIKNQSKGKTLKEWQEMLYKIKYRWIMWKLNKVELWYTALRVIARNMHNKFGVMITKLCSGLEMLYKINQRGIILKRNKVDYGSCAMHFRIIARSMHTMFGVIWTYDDKVTLRTKKTRRRRRRRGRRRRPK